MRKISKVAQKVIEKIMGKMKDGYVKIDNTGGTFMPLSAQMVGEIPGMGKIVSLAHYGLQNGDCMADPEMEFLVADITGEMFPLSFTNHYIGLHQKVIHEFAPDGKIKSYKPGLQKQLAVFTVTWMENIRQQQGI